LICDYLLWGMNVFAEAKKEQEVWDTRGDTDPNRTIPLLMRNKIPDGYETDDKLDVTLRPDEVFGHKSNIYSYIASV